METTILLVRHGETDWNLARRVQGQTDRPLNETGRRQARELAERLAGEPIHAVYSSDLARARETAEIIAASRRLSVTVVPQLREKDFGTWEGLTDEEVRARFPQASAGPWGDAETSEQLAARVLAALRRIAADHPGQLLLVVAHGGPLRALVRHCGGDGTAAVENCHLVRVGSRGEALRLLD